MRKNIRKSSAPARIAIGLVVPPSLASMIDRRAAETFDSRCGTIRRILIEALDAKPVSRRSKKANI